MHSANKVIVLKKVSMEWYGVQLATHVLPCVSQERTQKSTVFTQLGFFSEGAPVCSEESLWCSLLSVAVPEHSNCTAFLCFPHLPPLSRLKATDFVWLYKMGWDMFSSQCFLVHVFVCFCYVRPDVVKCSTLHTPFALWNAVICNAVVYKLRTRITSEWVIHYSM